MRLRGGGDVEVVEHLEMIREELHRRDEHRAMSRSGERGEELAQVGPQPLLRGMARALVGPPPPLGREPGAMGDELGGLAQLRDVLGLGVGGRMLRRSSWWG